CVHRKPYCRPVCYSCFTQFTTETTMSPRSVHPAPVRTLISPARSSDAPSAAVAAENLAGPAVGSVDAVVRAPRTEDHFVRIVSSRPSSEVNPHLWTWQAEALDA